MDLKTIKNENELRKIQMGILEYFISVCKKNGIKYFMAYGSLLGTIRHKGYIPWDDDIDVAILRKDVDKLALVFDDGKYKIINSDIDNKYFSPLIKAYDDSTILIQDYGQIEGKNIGVYIDIFVIDNVPLDEKKRKVFFKTAERMRFEWSLSCRSIGAKSRNKLIGACKGIVSIPFRIIGFRFFAHRYLKYVSSYKDEGCYAIVLYGEGYDKEYVYNANDLTSTEKPFESLFVSIPINYDLILKKCYGDYMTIPPADQRKKHIFKAYKKII